MLTQKQGEMAANGKINYDDTAASVKLQNQIRRTCHDLFLFPFGLSIFFLSSCFMFAPLIGRVPFHFLELVQMREFIHYAIMSHAIRNTNPFCLLSFSLASIFSLTPKIVHTTYCEWFTLETRHSDSWTQTQILVECECTK